MEWKWSITSATGICFVEAGDKFTANTASGQTPTLNADCKDTANTQLWNSATLSEGASEEEILGSMTNDYDFVITHNSNRTVDCVLTDTDPNRSPGESGGWNGDDQ